MVNVIPGRRGKKTCRKMEGKQEKEEEGEGYQRSALLKYLSKVSTEKYLLNLATSRGLAFTC